MYWYLKIISLNFLFISAFLASQSISLLSSWVLLELSTLSFIFYLSSDSTFFDSFQEMMKMFLIQAFSGVMLLILFIVQEINVSFNLSMMMCLILLLKMGAVPFHSWLLHLCLNFSWSSLYLFLTLQKFIPLQILSFLTQTSIFFIAIISFFLVGILFFFVSNLKQIIVISSLFFLSMLFLTLEKSMIWIELLLIYSMIFLPLSLFVWLISQQTSFISIFFNKNFNNMMIFIFLISLAGLPPTPGFFMKYLWFLNISFELFSTLTFILVSGLMVYMYLGFSFNLMSTSSYSFVSWKSYSNLSFFLIYSGFFFSFLFSMMCFF